MIAPASSRPARMKWCAFRRVGAAHDDCVWTTSGEGPLGWRSSQTCRLGQFSTHARFMSLGNIRSARRFHRGASSQGDRGSGCGDSGSGCSDARLCACSCSSRPLAGSPRGRCLLLLNPVLHCVVMCAWQHGGNSAFCSRRPRKINSAAPFCAVETDQVLRLYTPNAANSRCLVGARGLLNVRAGRVSHGTMMMMN